MVSQPPDDEANLTLPGVAGSADADDQPPMFHCRGITAGALSETMDSCTFPESGDLCRSWR
jgi:hypothetical protein